MSKPASFLNIDSLTVRFGGVVALNKVSLTMPPNQILGLIGPNGSGKTTLFNCLSRIYTPESGHIYFEGRSLLQESPHTIIRRGIARTFQNLALFRSMSVLDNVLVGAHINANTHLLGDFLQLPAAKVDQQRIRQEAMEILQFLELEAYAHRLAVDLPFAIQKRVELGRALISKPKLLLLDEPANGLNHVKIEELKKILLRIKAERHIAILIVEHNMNLVMELSERVIALDFGKKIADDIPRKVQLNADVIDSYLGKKFQSTNRK
jgi:branched-chain amino acid transport system ATP-binding protein